MARGKSLCIFGAKGGIGKSVFTLNLAGVLSNMQKKVLIIDLDLCNGSIAMALNKSIDKTIFHFCDDYINNRYSDIKDYLIKYNDYIDVLACPKDPRQANKIDIKYIDILIDKCLFMYDYVLIDTTHHLNELNIFTFDKVDNILFLTTNDLLALKNLCNLLAILKDNEISKYKILLNNSVNPDKSYFSLYDIKNIIHDNIDYVLSDKFYSPNIDTIILNGEIMTIKNPKSADYKIFELIIASLSKKDGEAQ